MIDMMHKRKILFGTHRSFGPRRGATVLDLLLAGGLIFGVVFALQVAFLQLGASSRDLRRLADIREAEIAFQQLFRSTGGFGAAAQDGGCSDAGSLLETCNFSRINKRQILRDPGDGHYRVSVVPTETAFEITFALERSHDGLAAGRHTLTPVGIR